jgi:hypothetical protein
MQFAGFAPDTLNMDEHTKLDQEQQRNPLNLSWLDENLESNVWASRWLAQWDSAPSEQLRELGLKWLRMTSFQALQADQIIRALRRSNDPRATQLVLDWLRSTNAWRNEWTIVWMVAAKSGIKEQITAIALENMSLISDDRVNRINWIRIWSLLYPGGAYRDELIDVVRRHVVNKPIDSSVAKGVLFKSVRHLQQEIGESETVLDWVLNSDGRTRAWPRLYCAVLKSHGAQYTIVKRGLGWLAAPDRNPKYWREVWYALIKSDVDRLELYDVTVKWLRRKQGKVWPSIFMRTHANRIWNEDIRSAGEKWLASHRNHREAQNVAGLLKRPPLQP